MPVYIGLGANLDHPRYGSPRQTLTAALEALAGVGVRTVRKSRWYRSSPIPPSGQPWYMNAVAQVLTGLGPDATLAALHRVEEIFGRVRRKRDEARVIDLDLLDYDSIVKINNNNDICVLPHPRLELRAFVLLPLAELDPGWRHPVSHKSIATLIAGLPRDQQIAPLSD
jgi:2-amino-4-hydroxy-6-hydroxymethyldihydropteridine diphosphokinase